MENIYVSKKNLFGVLFSAVIFLFCLVVSVTFVDLKILSVVQVIFHKTLRNPDRWIEIIRHTAFIVIFFTLTVDFLKYIKSGNFIWNEIKSSISEFKKSLEKKTLVYAGGVTLFLFIVFSKIIYSDFFYADDIFRNYTGNRSWIGFSRYVSEFCSILFHTNLRLNDIAPLTQIISIFLMTATVFVFVKAITGAKYTVLNLLAGCFIFISPFYSENISYRFDCPYMVLAVLFAVLPFLFTSNRKTFIFTSIISLILTSMSYQSALSVYILITIFLTLKKITSCEDKKSIFNFILDAVISFIAALLIFKLFFMNTMSNSADDYFSTKISVSTLLPNCINYVKTTFKLFGNNFGKFFLVLSTAGFVFSEVKVSKINKAVSVILCLAVLILSSVLSFGPYLIFERPLMTARAFMGFNCFVSLLALSISDTFEHSISSKLFTACALLLTYSSIVFMFVTGNCYSNQKNYENFRTTLLLKDISEVTSNSQIYDISFEGTVGICQKNRIAYRNYPLLKNLVPVFPNGSSSWNDEIFNGYNFKCISEDRNFDDSFVKVRETYYHDIYIKENKIHVILK